MSCLQKLLPVLLVTQLLFAFNGVRAAFADDESHLLPALGARKSDVDRRLDGVQKYQPGSDAGLHIYLMRAADGSEATVTLEYAKDHRGQLVFRTVKVNTGRSGDQLSSSWNRAFARAYAFNHSRIPLSSLSERARNDGTPSKYNPNEQVSFHTLPALATLDNSWFFDHSGSGPATWRRGKCPLEEPTLIMKYSDSPGKDIEIYSEFLGDCFAIE